MTFIVKVKSENSLEIPLLLHSNESYFKKILALLGVFIFLSLSYRFHLMRLEMDEAQASALKAEMTLAEGLEDLALERTRELKEANDTIGHQAGDESLTSK